MNKVGIIGGMGPYAGLNYLHAFLDECSILIRSSKGAINDQCFPPHYLMQHPVPDRTSALSEGVGAYRQVREDVSNQLRALDGMGVRAAAIACNTAHAWHEDLQEAVPGIHLLHIADGAAQCLLARSVERVGLLSTAGTVRSGMYARSLRAKGIECIAPDDAEMDTLMIGIYDGVKAGNLDLGKHCFSTVVSWMKNRAGITSFLMACTEIPLVLSRIDVDDDVCLHDPSRISAQILAQIALGSNDSACVQTPLSFR